MRSTKTIGLFTACGFILSFVAGLFSHSSILSILIKALIFAVIFGALGFGISVVFSKFLSTGTSGDFQSDYSVDSSSGTANASASVTGQHVDITIQDEELKPSGSDNHFVVGDNHQMLNDSDMANSSGTGNTTVFVPLRNFETVKSVSGTESIIPSQAVVKETTTNETAPVTKSPAAVPVQTPVSSPAFEEEGIDTLPDMDGFVFGDDVSSQNNSDDDNDTDGEMFDMRSLLLGIETDDEAS